MEVSYPDYIFAYYSKESVISPGEINRQDSQGNPHEIMTDFSKEFQSWIVCST